MTKAGTNIFLSNVYRSKTIPITSIHVQYIEIEKPIEIIRRAIERYQISNR